jgi:hypothetical protein
MHIEQNHLALAGCALALFHAVFALKALDPAGGIDQALLAGIKGMTVRAHLYVDFRQSGARLESIAARAGYNATAVGWVDLSFHSPRLAYLVL